MSAAARGAAGWLSIQRRNAARVIREQVGDVEAFVQQLMKRFNVSEARARELAAEQAEKTFNRRRG